MPPTVIKCLSACVGVLLIGLNPPVWSANPGDADTSFAVEALQSGVIPKLVPMADGRLIVAGAFSKVNGEARVDIIRLTAAGVVDTTFNTGTGARWSQGSDADIAVAVQADGRMLVGGLFSEFNGIATKLIRLNVDGSRDLSFPDVQMTGFSVFAPQVYAVMVQADGKIVVGGNFTAVHGVARHNLARLNPDGTLDESFTASAGSDVRLLQSDSQGRILVGGKVTSLSGTSLIRLGRLSANGQVDTAFVPLKWLQALTVEAVMEQEDGKFLVGGTYTSGSSGPVGGFITRVNEDGSQDTSFQEWRGVPGSVDSLVRNGQGGFLAGGKFVNAGGLPQSGLMALDGNGAVLPAAQQVEVRGRVRALHRLADGKLMIGGQIGSVQGKLRLGMARLSADLSVDDGFQVRLSQPMNYFVESRMAVTRLQRLTDGGVAVMGQFDALAEQSDDQWSASSKVGVLNANLGLDEAFSRPDFTEMLAEVHTVARTGDGGLLMGGARTVDHPEKAAPVFKFSSIGVWDGTTVQKPSPLQLVRDLDVLADGKILVAGQANHLTQQGIQEGLRRWLPDGGEDTSFPLTATSDLKRVKRMVDGRIVVMGKRSIWRFKESGELDPAFTPPVMGNGDLENLVLLPGDKMLVVGNFGSVNQQPRARVARLLANGQVDTTFNIGTSPDGIVHDVLVRQDGDVVIAGGFQNINGVARKYLAQLDPNGALRTSFPTGSGPDGFCFSLLKDGEDAVLVGGRFRTINGIPREGLARVWLTASGPSITPPEAPEGVTGLAVTAQRAMITWEPEANAEEYLIERRVAGTTDWLVAGSVTGGANSFEDNTVLPGTIYEYRLRAWNAAGDAPPVVIGPIIPASNEGIAGSLLPGTELSLWKPGDVNVVARQTDGKLLVGGVFSRAHGLERKNLVRFHADGSLDTSFQMTEQFSSDVRSVAVQSDGRIIVGGTFSKVGTVARSYLARLLSDGSLDTNFQVGIGLGTGPNGTVRCVKVLENDKILVGGNFTKWGGLARPYIIRLNADGSEDTSYEAASPNAGVNAMAVTTDGKLLLGGNFSRVNNRDGTSVRNTRVARLLPDGRVDASYALVAAGSSPVVYSLDALTGGEVMVAGSFDEVNGAGYMGLVRLDQDGAIHPAFKAGLKSSGIVRSVTKIAGDRVVIAGSFWSYGAVRRDGFAVVTLENDLVPGVPSLFPIRGEYTSVLPDGDILVGGSFHTVQGARHQGVAKIKLMDFTVDPAFYASVTRGGWAQRMLKLADGSALILGSFSSVGGPDDVGAAHYGMLKLRPDDTIDPNFAKGPGFELEVSAVAEADDGKIWVGGEFARFGLATRYRIARLNADGSLDTTFAPGISDSNIEAILPETGGRVLVGGPITSVGGQTRRRLARFGNDGTLLADFQGNSGINGTTVNVLRRDLQGHVMVGGDFISMLSFSWPNFGRLLSSDIADTTFRPRVNGPLQGIHVHPTDGRMVIAGSFTTVGSGSSGTDTVQRPALARFFSNGNVDHSFATTLATNSSVRGSAQGDNSGLLVFGGIEGAMPGRRLYMAQFREDGSFDPAFESPVLNTGSVLDTIASEDRVLISGNFNMINGEQRVGMARLRRQTTLVAPAAPQSVTVSELGNGLIGLAWQAVSSASGYVLEGRQGMSSNWQVLQLGTAAALGYQHTGLSAGDVWSYRLKAFNGAGYSDYSGEVTAVVPGNFAQWLNGWDLSAGSAATDDPDGDGVSLFEEYARGLSPIAMDTALSGDAELDEEGLSLTYYRAQPSLIYRVYRSDDLVTWSLEGVDQGGSGPWVTASVPASPSVGRCFLRLVITQ